MNHTHVSKFIAAFILLSGIVVFTFSCKKDNNANRVTATYNFSYAGTLAVGDTIRFSSTAPGTSSFLWKFGDGVTSADSLPYHIYTTGDSFIVTLIINNDSAHAIQKILHIGSTSPTYTFFYSGNLWVGDSITFQSTAPANNTFLWTFGDGTTSTQAIPVHIYNSIPLINYNYAADTVSLIINNDTAHPIKKALQIAPGIQRVATMRTWQRIHYAGPDNNVAAYPLPDTSFAINVISDMTISVLGNTLMYNPNYSQSPNYLYISASLIYNPIKLTYSNLSDTLKLSVDQDGGALGGQDYTLYQSP